MDIEIHTEIRSPLTCNEENYKILTLAVNTEVVALIDLVV